MDDIQQKLVLIDRQLTSGKDFHKQFITTCSLLFAAIGLIAGIVIQTKVALHPIAWLIPIFLAAIITIFAAFLKSSHKPTILAYLVFFTFLSLGAIRLINFYHAKPNDISNLVSQQQSLATIQGVILTKPRIRDASQWQFSKFQPSANSSDVLKIAGWRAPD